MLATFEQKISAVKLDPKLGFTGPGKCTMVHVGSTRGAMWSIDTICKSQAACVTLGVVLFWALYYFGRCIFLYV